MERIKIPEYKMLPEYNTVQPICSQSSLGGALSLNQWERRWGLRGQYNVPAITQLLGTVDILFRPFSRYATQQYDIILK